MTRDILEVDLLSTLYWIKRTMDSAIITTIQYSFRKGGFQSEMPQNNNHPENENLEDLFFKDLFESSSMCTMDDFLKVDYEIYITEELTDDNIMNRIKENITKTITHEQPDDEPEPKNNIIKTSSYIKIFQFSKEKKFCLNIVKKKEHFLLFLIINK